MREQGGEIAEVEFPFHALFRVLETRVMIGQESLQRRFISRSALFKSGNKVAAHLLALRRR